MGYDRIAGRLYGRPHVITPDKAAIIEAIFRAHVEGNAPKQQVPSREEQETQYAVALAASIGAVRRSDGGYYLTGDGIAIIPVLGSLVHRGTMLDAMSGLTSYDRIGGMLDAAMNDYRVRGIAMDIDSPGGEGAGVIDLSRRINAASKKKPLYAVADEHALSAAYWLASGAGRIVLPESGMVGSVGVLLIHVDQSVANEKRGLTVTQVHAGAKKIDFSPHAPMSDRARASAQAMVDRMYGQFVDAVATHRDIDAQIVRDTEAGLLDADEALVLGLADDVGTLADALELMREELRAPAQTTARRAESAATSEKDDDMTTEKTQAAANAGADPTQLANERDAGRKEGSATGKAEGMKAERDRVKAITTCDAAKERPTLAAYLAFETDMSIETAQALLAKAAKETPDKPANLLDAALRGKNPAVGGDVDSGDKAPRKPPMTSAQIFEMRKQNVIAHRAK